MNNKQYTTVNSCPITGDTSRFTYLDLGQMPLVNNLSLSKEASLSCAKYPLAVQHFPESKLSCLTENINPDLVFSQYSYKSGVAKAYADHCEEMFQFVSKYVSLAEGDSVLDVGGNDGTLLKAFRKLNPKLDVLNIDASKNLTSLSEEDGVPSMCAYWGVETAKKLGKKFKLITSTNVFQHTPPIEDFTQAISLSLAQSGVWCLEFPYWKASMETNQYDQVYHEHVYYYLVEPLKHLLDKFNLEIIKVIPQPIHGGSLRLLIAHSDDVGIHFQPCKEVNTLIAQESELTVDYYKNWGNNIQAHIANCREFLISLKAANKKIVGFGAAAKGCIFLNTAGIDDTVLDCVIDDTDLKQNKFIPGTGIQIRSRDYLLNNDVDYVLILAHNFKDVIIADLSRTYSGKFITLFPSPQII